MELEEIFPYPILTIVMWQFAARQYATFQKEIILPTILLNVVILNQVSIDSRGENSSLFTLSAGG